MNVRVRPDGRKVWPWWRRVPVRVGRWAWNLFVGPFLTKHSDGTIQASMTRVAVAAFTVAEIMRLIPVQGADGGWTVAPIGWPDAFLAFCILFALPIDGALAAVAKRNPEKLVDALLSRMGVGDVANVAPSFTPHQWRDGDPDEGVV